jgi:hypothetical protein
LRSVCGSQLGQIYYFLWRIINVQT